MSTLRIYFSESWHDAATPCQWALCDDAGRLLQQGSAPLAALPKADNAVAVIPAARVLSGSVKMPAGSRRRWLAALPFMAEERTLLDPEENHVVPGKAASGESLPLFIVDKRWLRTLVEACRVAGVSLRGAIPEMFLSALPNRHRWVMVLDGKGGFVRTGPDSGFALDSAGNHDVPVALHLALAAQQALRPDGIEVRFTEDTDASARKLPQWENFPVPLVAGPVWAWQRESIVADAPNLLWGEFAPRARLSGWLPRLRPLAFILLAAFCIEVAGTHLEWAILAKERHELGSRMETLFRSSFGQNSAMVNAPLQMQRNLADLRHAAGLADDADFIPLLDRAAPVFATFPAGSLRALNFDSGQLDVIFRVGKPDELKQLQQRLEARGLTVRVGKAADSNGGTEARIVIRKEVGR